MLLKIDTLTVIHSQSVKIRKQSLKRIILKCYTFSNNMLIVSLF